MATNFLVLSTPDPWLAALGSRIREAREGIGLGRKAFGKAVEKSDTSIQNYETGKSEPPASLLLRVAKETGRSVDWLLTGAGPTTNILADDTARSYAPRERVSELPPEFSETFTLTIYTHVEASAGDGLFGTEPYAGDLIEVERVKRLFAELLGFWPPDDMRGIRVRGVSMNRAYGGIIDGQIVLYRPVSSAAEVEDGARHVLTVSEGEDSRVLVKRVQLLMGGGVRLSADNASASVVDEVLVPADAPEADGLVNRETGQPVHLTILGRVIWPTETVDLATAEVVAQTLEALIGRGYLPSKAA